MSVVFDMKHVILKSTFFALFLEPQILFVSCLFVLSTTADQEAILGDLTAAENRHSGHYGGHHGGHYGGHHGGHYGGNYGGHHHYRRSIPMPVHSDDLVGAENHSGHYGGHYGGHGSHHGSHHGGHHGSYPGSGHYGGYY